MGWELACRMRGLGVCFPLGYSIHSIPKQLVQIMESAFFGVGGRRDAFRVYMEEDRVFGSNYGEFQKFINFWDAPELVEKFTSWSGEMSSTKSGNKGVGVSGKIKGECKYCWTLACESVLLLECGCWFFDLFRVTIYVEAEVFVVFVTFGCLGCLDMGEGRSWNAARSNSAKEEAIEASSCILPWSDLLMKS